MNNTIYYQRRNGSIKFKYGATGQEMMYVDYPFAAAYRLFKAKIGVKRAHLEKVEWLYWLP